MTKSSKQEKKRKKKNSRPFEPRYATSSSILFCLYHDQEIHATHESIDELDYKVQVHRI